MRAIPYVLTFLVIAGCIALLLLREDATTAAPSATTNAPGESGRTYYVDAASGSDQASGQRPESAWQTLAAVRRAALEPGDQVLLRRGETWRESLNLSASGTKASPIVIGAYGTGAAPAIRGSDRFDSPEDWHDGGAGPWYLIGIADDPGMLVYDGNYGVRRTSMADLKSDWDFYHDRTRGRLYVQLAENPANVAKRIEIPVREFVVGPLEADHIALRDLDLGHGWNMGLLAWDSDYLTVTGCTFVGSAGNHVQFQHGSNRGRVVDSTFDDWNLRDELAYAIQVIAEQSGPVDIRDCVFTATRRGGGKDHTAIMNDYNGWVRTVQGCRFTGNDGALADEGVVIWRLAATADSVTIENNTFTGLGGTAIMLQELEHYGAKATVAVFRNRIENVCLGDDLDKDALRARQFGSASRVVIGYNVVNGAAAGDHPHAGIGVREASGLQIVNNLIRGADVGVELKPEVDDISLYNNVILGNRVAGVRLGATADAVNLDHNIYFENGGDAVAGGTMGPHSRVAAPLLDGNWVPRAESPCVDAGKRVEGLDRDLAGAAVPAGGAPDIGVREYVP